MSHQKETPCVSSDVQASTYSWPPRKRPRKFVVIGSNVTINSKLPSLDYVILVLTFILSPAFRQGFKRNRRNRLTIKSKEACC